MAVKEITLFRYSSGVRVEDYVEQSSQATPDMKDRLSFTVKKL